MKNLYLVGLLAVFFIACSNDDATDTTPVEPEFSIPLNNGNWWTYNVLNNGTTLRDSLYIFGDMTVNSMTYKKFKTRNDVAVGFYTSTLKNNGIRKDNNLLRYTGNIDISQILGIPTAIPVDNFIIFKSNATVDEVLNTKTSTIQQNVNNTPITIDYTLTTLGGQSFATFNSPNSTSHSNVKSTKIKLNLKITTVQVVGGIPVTITILQPQDVLLSTIYIAANKGVVYVNTDTTYTLAQEIATMMGIPATNSDNIKEFLHTTNIN